jgi:hypothetical protein
MQPKSMDARLLQAFLTLTANDSCSSALLLRCRAPVQKRGDPPRDNASGSLEHKCVFVCGSLICLTPLLLHSPPATAVTKLLQGTQRNRCLVSKRQIFIGISTRLCASCVT